MKNSQWFLLMIVTLFLACVEKPEQVTPAPLEDGTYLMDSSMGIQSYVVIKQQEIDSMYALRSDGTPSDRIVVQMAEQTTSAKTSCGAGCQEVCIVINLRTGATKCFCHCDIATTLGIKLSEFQKIVRHTPLKSLQNKLILERQ